MDLLRHYFISDSLDDLEVFEEQLEAAGVATPQIHVLSQKVELAETGSSAPYWFIALQKKSGMIRHS
jgi:hypothetical protein